MRSAMVVRRLVALALVAILGLAACGGDEEGGALPGWPDAESATYTLVTDCESANPEENCGAFIDLNSNGFGGYLSGGDIVDGIEWNYTSSDVIEMRLEGQDEVIHEFLVVGSELHEVETNRIFTSSPNE